MQPLEFVTMTCPHCGAGHELAVDLSTLPARYVEDCQTCCAPLNVDAALNPRTGELHISVCREND